MNKKPETPGDQSASAQLTHSLLGAERVANTAKKGHKSLKGDNIYAEHFHNHRTQATRAFKEVNNLILPVATPGLERTLEDIEKELAYFFDPSTSAADRRDLRRHIEMLLTAEVEPTLTNSGSSDFEFIPLEIVEKTRGYVVSVARQANRCFQNDCYDACAVMARRLLETLIIEVFEKKGIANKIKDSNGNYLMFTDLVGKLINALETPVGRTTKKELPNTALVLNNCAHSRTFNIGRSQLSQHQTVIVIAVQELTSLWDIRKP